MTFDVAYVAEVSLTRITERYLQLLKTERVKGYLGEQQNYYDKGQ